MLYPPLPGNWFPTEKPWQDLEVTTSDRNIASIAVGWTLGFGFTVVVAAVRETRRVGKLNTYVTLLWVEMAASLMVCLMAYLYLQKIAKPSFMFFFWILFAWAVQIQCLLQIIINRICILLDNNKQRNILRLGVAALITAINIGVFCTWVPAKLQISESYIHANAVWDRAEKVIYLIVDAALNWYFIHKVKSRLIEHGGLKKYRRLVAYNTHIIWISLAMDVLIIGMMQLPNELVYTLFHPIAYLVKLKIEMAMSNLIIKVAREAGIIVHEDSTANPESTGVRGTNTMQVSVQVTRTQHQEDIELAEQGRAVWRPQNSTGYDGSTKSTEDLDRKVRLD